MTNAFADALDRLLAQACPSAVLRDIEAGGPANALWARIAASGFADALVAEAQGGGGLTLAEAFALFELEGRHLLPLPLGQTLLVRAALARAGVAAPEGAIAIAQQVRWGAEGAITCANTPLGWVAEWVVVDRAGVAQAVVDRAVAGNAAGEHRDADARGGWLLLPTAAARRQRSGIHGSLRADLHWKAQPAEAIAVASAIDWRAAGAAVAAAQMAGAMARVLQMSVAFANQREQFGRPIGKFQAIQHQLAVMAEQVSASHMAAQIGCCAPMGASLPEPLRAALAKARCSEAAPLVAHIAHAVHGAIGVSADLDLQLFTRRLHEWRADYGAEQHWQRLIGRALLAPDAGSALDFMRRELLPANPEIAS